MTVPVQDYNKTFDRDSVVADTPYNMATFKVFRADELRVYYNTDQLATLGMHYTITLYPESDYSTADITFTSALLALATAGTKIIVRYEHRHDQEVDFSSKPALDESDIETVLDKLVLRVGELRDRMRLAWKAPAGSENTDATITVEQDKLAIGDKGNLVPGPTAGDIANAQAYAEAAAQSAADAAQYGDSLIGSSTDNLTIGTGSVGLTIELNKQFQVGGYVVISDNAAPTTNFMIGQITAYDPATTGNMTVNVSVAFGTGTHTAWTVHLSGRPGADGAAGAPGAAGPAGANAGLTYVFDSGVTSGDPGSGRYRLDNADPSAAKEMYINPTTDGGSDVKTYLQNLAARRATIVLRQVADKGNYLFLRITDAAIDNTSYLTLPVIAFEHDGVQGQANSTPMEFSAQLTEALGPVVLAEGTLTAAAQNFEFTGLDVFGHLRLQVSMKPVDNDRNVRLRFGSGAGPITWYTGNDYGYVAYRRASTANWRYARDEVANQIRLNAETLSNNRFSYFDINIQDFNAARQTIVRADGTVWGNAGSGEIGAETASGYFTQALALSAVRLDMDFSTEFDVGTWYKLEGFLRG